MYNLVVSGILLMGVCVGAFADEARTSADVSPGVAEDQQPPSEAESIGDTEPKVTIVRQKEQMIEEYRLNGQLYMIKVTPKRGKPYYLVDADGDGNLESRRNDLVPSSLVPTWVLFRW